MCRTCRVLTADHCPLSVFIHPCVLCWTQTQWGGTVRNGGSYHDPAPALHRMWATSLYLGGPPVTWAALPSPPGVPERGCHHVPPRIARASVQHRKNAALYTQSGRLPVCVSVGAGPRTGTPRRGGGGDGPTRYYSMTTKKTPPPTHTHRPVVHSHARIDPHLR